MWWTRPRLPDAAPLLPPNVLDLLVRVYAIVEVGGVGGSGPERGRNFEQLFYKICDRLGVHLTEKAGGRSVAGQRSASGFAHEVDGATRAAIATTYWELKHLSSPLEKNELLIFNGKALDYLYDGSSLFRNAPLLRFLLSGRNIRDDCRVYGVQWGMSLIRFRGHFPKGGYDVQNGITQSGTESAAAVHGRVHGRRGPARVG